MRLDKLLSNAGLGSRKEIKKILRQGGFTVDGAVITDPGTEILPGQYDKVSLNGAPLVLRHTVHLLMNKPAGYITANEDPRLPVVSGLIPDEWSYASVKPVGRLDRDTTGLLLFSNDGELNHRLTSPKWKVAKTYAVTISGKPFSEADIALFAAGIRLDDGLTLPADLTIHSPTEADLVLREGRFHQVKRMMIATGRTVTALHRSRLGPIILDDDLGPGGCRSLSEAETLALYEVTGLERPEI